MGLQARAWSPGLDGHHGRHLVASITTASRAAARDEQYALLRDALDQMDEQDREILALRHFEQLSNDEVAQLLGLKKTTASQRYIRALKRIKASSGASPGSTRPPDPVASPGRMPRGARSTAPWRSSGSQNSSRVRHLRPAARGLPGKSRESAVDGPAAEVVIPLEARTVGRTRDEAADDRGCERRGPGRDGRRAGPHDTPDATEPPGPDGGGGGLRPREGGPNTRHSAQESQR